MPSQAADRTEAAKLKTMKRSRIIRSKGRA
jgi:hypothetical protein